MPKRKRGSGLGRRGAHASLMSRNRQQETHESRHHRLQQDRLRHAAVRFLQSDQDQDRLRHAATRSRQSEEARQEDNRRRSTSRRRAAPASFFREPRAAFSYDCTKAYGTDSVVCIGELTVECQFCHAKKFKGETPGMCCSGGKVKLPALPEPPSPLKELLDGSHPKSKSFLGRIRRYNAAFQMTLSTEKLT